MITPMDIHNKTFSKKLRGYADDEVNSFLEEVASDYERIYREHREMEEQMDSLKSRLAHYEKMEATMSSTLVMAQETAENVKTTAKKEADVIVREAQNKAAQIDKIIFMLYTLNYRTLPGTKNCREKYETKVKENSNEKTGRLFKESILSLNEDRAEEKQDPSGGELWRDQRGVKPQVREGRVFRFQRSLC